MPRIKSDQPKRSTRKAETLESYVAVPAALGAAALGASVAERIALAVDEYTRARARRETGGG